MTAPLNPEQLAALANAIGAAVPECDGFLVVLVTHCAEHGTHQGTIAASRHRLLSRTTVITVAAQEVAALQRNDPEHVHSEQVFRDTTRPPGPMQ